MDRAQESPGRPETVDELGKSITSDNDYILRPVVAFIHLIFVVLFPVTRALVTTGHPSPQAAPVNLYGLASKDAVRPLNGSERARALHLLAAHPALIAVVGLLAGIAVIASAAGDSGTMTRNFWTSGEAISVSVTAALIVVRFARWRRSRLAVCQDQLAEVFGLAMVLIMVFRPRGLVSSREPSIRLHPAGSGGGG